MDEAAMREYKEALGGKMSNDDGELIGEKPIDYLKLREAAEKAYLAQVTCIDILLATPAMEGPSMTIERGDGEDHKRR